MSDKIKSLEELRNMKEQVYHKIALREYSENPVAFRKANPQEADKIENYLKKGKSEN
ncbi:MAG: hypothetical protein FWD02_02595 [Bacteroidales bacterium]|nr:hypothetical protein [Bacteroidales bacterium]